MKIGILYIALGKYTILWEEFYKSAEKYFVGDFEKQYFVYTDADNIYAEDERNVHKIYQENLGWPNSTLMRFQMFLKNKNDLENTDYLYFFNANLKFVQKVGQEFILENENLLVVKHPGFINAKSSIYYPYCRQKKSTAYIPYGKGKIYVQGALNGGKTTAFIDMISSLAENISNDLSRGIIAEVHDESHLNKYICKKDDIKVLGVEYVYPEGWKLDVDAKIISRDKNRYFDTQKMKRKTIKEWYFIIKNKVKVEYYERKLAKG